MGAGAQAQGSDVWAAGRAAILCRPDAHPALGSLAAFPLEGAIQAFRELPEGARGLSKHLVFFLEVVNGLDTVFKRIPLVPGAHGPPFRSGRSMSKKGAAYG
jgi:hypothetical protein